MEKNVVISIAISIVLIIGAIFLVPPSSEKRNINNVELKDGIQYVTIEARGGYSPRKTEVKSGIPTKLIVKTNGTYDCSAALVIKEFGYQGILKQKGEEIIDLGILDSGKKVEGMCSMGMYYFEIEAV